MLEGGTEFGSAAAADIDEWKYIDTSFVCFFFFCFFRQRSRRGILIVSKLLVSCNYFPPILRVLCRYMGLDRPTFEAWRVVCWNLRITQINTVRLFAGRR